MTLSELGNAVMRAYGLDFALRFMGYVAPQADGCWLWLGGKAGMTDRPCVWLNRRCVYVARLVLRLRVDRPLKRGKLAGHTCDNVLCVNPAHVEEVTYSKNLKDAWARGRRNRPSTFTEV